MTVAQGDGKPDIAFSSDGTLKSVELKIMNLRPDGRSNQDLIWEQVNFHLTFKYLCNGLWSFFSKKTTAAHGSNNITSSKILKCALLVLDHVVKLAVVRV